MKTTSSDTTTCGGKHHKACALLHGAALLLTATILRAQDALQPASAQADDGNEAPAAIVPPSSAIPEAKPPKPEIKRENLITNSPFRTARVLSRTGGNTQQLEIRGFYGSGDALEVSLTNPLTRECHWVKVGDSDARWKVTSADPVARTAVVEMNGMVISVSMAQVDERPLSIASSAPSIAPPVARPVTTGMQPGSGAIMRPGMGSGPGVGPGVGPGRAARSTPVQEENTSGNNANVQPAESAGRRTGGWSGGGNRASRMR